MAFPGCFLPATNLSRPKVDPRMKLLIGLIRLALLLGALGAGATWLIWEYRPQWVHQFDVRIQSYYKGRYQKPVEAALAEMAKDRAAGIPKVLAAIDRIPPVFKEDKLFDFRQGALKTLAKACLAEGLFEQAQELASRVSEADPNDLTGRLLYIDCLGATDATLRQGQVAAAELATAFPKQVDVVQRAVQLGLRVGDTGAAAYHAASFLMNPGVDPAQGQGLDGPWYGWWSETRSFDPKRRANAVVQRKGRQVEATFEVPSGQHWIRIDFPPYASAQFLRPEWSLGPEGTWTGIADQNDSVRHHHLQVEGDTLRLEGLQDPWMIFPVPAELQGSALSVRWRAELTGSFPWLEDALIGGGWCSAQDRFESHSLSAAQRAAWKVQSDGLLRSGLGLRAGPQQSFHLPAQPHETVLGRVVWEGKWAPEAGLSWDGRLEWVLPSACQHIGGVKVYAGGEELRTAWVDGGETLIQDGADSRAVQPCLQKAVLQILDPVSEGQVLVIKGWLE